MKKITPELTIKRIHFKSKGYLKIIRQDLQDRQDIPQRQHPVNPVNPVKILLFEVDTIKLTIPLHGTPDRETLKSIIKSSGLTTEEFVELL